MPKSNRAQYQKNWVAATRAYCGNRNESGASCVYHKYSESDELLVGSDMKIADHEFMIEKIPVESSEEYPCLG